MSDSSNSTSRSLLHDSLTVLVTKVLVLALSMLSLVIQARALGAEGRGLLAMLLIYPQLFTSLAEGGMRQATVYYVGRNVLPEAQVFVASMLYSLLSAIAFAGFIFYLLSHSSEHTFSLLMILTATTMVPVNLLMNVVRSVLLGKQNIRQFNNSQWLQKVVLVSALSLLYGQHALTVENAMLTMLVASIVGFLPALHFFSRNVFALMDFHWSAFRWGALWVMMKKGSVFAFALFLIEANYKIDILLLGALAPHSEVGLYTVSVQVGQLLWQLPAALGVVVFSRSANDRGSLQWQLALARSVRLSLWISLFAAVALALLAPMLFAWLFAPEFSAAVNMTLALLPGLVPMVVFKLLNMDLAGKGMPFVSVWVMLPALLLNLVLNWFLIPPLGGQGAAIASSISYLAAVIAMLIAYSRLNQVAVRDFVLLRSEDLQLVAEKFLSKLPLQKEV